MLFRSAPRAGGRDAAGAAAASVGSASVVEGFRERLLAPGTAGQGDMLVIRTSLLRGLSILAGLGVAVVSLALSRIRGWLPLGVCIVAALVALWVVSPYEMIARTAWWGAVAAWWLRPRWLPAADFVKPVGLAIVACLLPLPVRAESPVGPVADPLRVYITPVDGGEKIGRAHV